MQGAERDIKKMEQWLHRGSPGATVDSVIIKECEHEKEYEGFEVKS